MTLEEICEKAILKQLQESEHSTTSKIMQLEIPNILKANIMKRMANTDTQRDMMKNEITDLELLTTYYKVTQQPFSFLTITKKYEETITNKNTHETREEEIVEIIKEKIGNILHGGPYKAKENRIKTEIAYNIYMLLKEIGQHSRIHFELEEYTENYYATTKREQQDENNIILLLELFQTQIEQERTKKALEYKTQIEKSIQTDMKRQTWNKYITYKTEHEYKFHNKDPERTRADIEKEMPIEDTIGKTAEAIITEAEYKINNNKENEAKEILHKLDARQEKLHR